MPSIAQMLGSIAENMVQKLNKINASLAKQGQSAANTFDDVSSKIEAIKSGANVSGVTASTGDVLEPKVFVDSSGAEQTGTMPNNGAVRNTLTVNKTSVDIPKGYHNGLGYTQIQLQEKTISPNMSDQDIVPDEGKVLSKVSVKKMNLQEKTASPKVITQFIEADSGYNGLKKVTINPIYLQHYTVYPKTYDQELTPGDEYDGFSGVTVKAMNPNLQYKYVTPAPFTQYVEADGGYDGLSTVMVHGASLYEEQPVSVSSDRKSISFTLSRNDVFPEKIIVYSDFHNVSESSSNIVLLELFLYRYRVEYVQTFWVRYRDADNYMDYDGIGYDSYAETLESLGFTLTKNGDQYTVTVSDSLNHNFNHRATLTAHVVWMNENW